MIHLIKMPIQSALPSALLLILLVSSALPASAAREKLGLRYLPLPLPGAPSAVVAADVDGDGHRDLAVVVAYTRWSQIEIEESVTMDDVEGLVEVLTVIPSLVERREIRVFPGRPDGGFGPGSIALPIDASILTVEAGPPGLPVVAMTDEGLSVLRMKSGTSPGASGPPELSWETVLSERSVLAGTGTFLPNLGLVRDVDGDQRADVLFPTSDGVSVYLSSGDGLQASPAARVRFPLDDLQRKGNPRVWRYPLPELRDVDGDRRLDMVLFHPAGELKGFRVLRNLGGGRFGEPLAPLGPYDEKDQERSPGTKKDNVPVPSWFGDLDGDGKAEYVTQEEKSPGEDVGFRKGMEAAKRPHFLYRLHRSRADLTMEPKPYQQFEVEGYALSGSSDEVDFKMPGGFQDLNGDGKQDLILTTLDFSVLQAVKIMTVQRIGIGLDFHLWCQAGGGGFRPVRGLDLSGKFNLNLNNLKIGHISQFEGDFDGDGRPEFVQMGRGRAVTIHRGRPDCGYNENPDLTLQLEEAPRDLSLAQVRDLDGDKLSDLLVIQPQPPRKSADEKGVTQPVRLDLYLSGGAR